MDLTPSQQRTLDGLLRDRDTPRPSFDAELALDLRDELEERLAPVAALLPDGEQLHVNKGALSQVLACERYHLAAAEDAFSWTVANARGTIAHKAVELSVTMDAETPPLVLVDAAIERILDDGGDYSPRDWLNEASMAEVAELKAEVNDIVVKFQECFPPLDKRWRPRTESPARVELCADAIVLRSKVDLALGRPNGLEARVVIIDLKTGRAHGNHIDDLRFYALLDTIRNGVPPFRIASYYLESARWHHEDVDAEVLRATVRRVSDGVIKLAELRLTAREPDITPNPACGWCPARDGCAGAETWVSMSAARALGEL
ncbi:MAG TPA: PD-(D/E)XK nuclease family protein [Acidimicrobiales bacterium]|nr:PD-(D/E)XK nuclease family protein [Acidimicrobiales bacterium]